MTGSSRARSAASRSRATSSGSWARPSRSSSPRRSAQAVDAAELVGVEYEQLPVVVDVEAAVADGAPLLWPEFGTNVAHAFGVRWDDDPLAGADVVVRGRFVNQRVAPAPMETNGIAVVPDADGSLHGVGLDAGPVRRARRPRGDAGCRARSRARDRARRGRRLRRQAADLPRVPRRGGDRGRGSAGRCAGRRRVRSRCCAHARPRAGPAGRARREARRHAGRAAGRAARRHGRVPDRRVHARHDPGDARRRLSDPARSRAAGGASSRTRRRSRPTAAPAGPRPPR